MDSKKSDTNIDKPFKKRKRKRKGSSASSDSSIDEKLKEKLYKKLKKLERKEKKKRKKVKKCKEKNKKEGVKRQDNETVKCDSSKSKNFAPMTKEEWEKQQNTLRRVYDKETGRTRLVRGNGEIVEECVSRQRQLAINKLATMKDGEYFQKVLSSNLK